MLTLGFFFLLRPGEYAHTTNPESAPFRLVNVHLHWDNIRINHLLAPIHILSTATFVCLEFTTQKNGIRGELIGMGRSGHPSFCPVQACINCITHLRQHSALRYTPLYSYFVTEWFRVSTTTLTTELRLAVTALGAEVGLTPIDVSIRSLRASGAMALLCALVDPDRIRLLSCWRSNKMLRYLHVQAYPVVAGLAPAMLTHGQFALISNQPNPQPRLSHNGARAIPVYRDTGMYIYIRKTKYFQCELLNSDSTIEFYACENIPLHRVRAHSAVE
jgi:hypothetical protein